MSEEQELKEALYRSLDTYYFSQMNPEFVEILKHNLDFDKLEKQTSDDFAKMKQMGTFTSVESVEDMQFGIYNDTWDMYVDIQGLTAETADYLLKVGQSQGYFQDESVTNVSQDLVDFADARSEDAVYDEIVSDPSEFFEIYG